MSTQPGFQYLTAMLYAIENINNDSTLLPGISLGARIYDTCRSQTIGADRAKDIIKYTLVHQGNGSSPLVGVIGPFTSDVSIAVAPLLRVFGIPQISYGSTSVDLSNKEVYPTFFRTVPPDSFQAEAIVDILKHFHWNYVLTINSEGNYGETGIENFRLAAKRKGICIAASAKIPKLARNFDYDTIMKNCLQPIYRRVKVIVLYSTQDESRRILHAAMKNGRGRFTWIGSNGWSNRADVTRDHEEVSDGSLTVNHLEGKVKGFRNFLMQLSPEQSNNPWIEEYWQTLFACRLIKAKTVLNFSRVCREDETYQNHLNMAPVRVVVNAVYAVAHALHNMQQTLCPNATGFCKGLKEHLMIPGAQLVKHLKNVTFKDASLNFTFKFNQNQELNGNYTIMNFRRSNSGEYHYYSVGSWGGFLSKDGTISGNLLIKDTNIYWANASLNPPTSICSYPCKGTETKVPKTINPSCCWTCRKCKLYSIIVNGTCLVCPLGYLPNANLSQCMKIPLVFPRFTDSASIGFLCLTCFGLGSTFTIAAFFVKHKDHKVVKAAGKEISSILTAGITACYLATIPYLTEPTDISCGVRQFTGSVCFTLCYAPVLMQTNRIYRIFNAAKRSVARPSFISPRSQVLITLGAISIQLLLTTIRVISAPPHKIEVYPNRHTAYLDCNLDNYSIGINLSYNLFLMLFCTLFAFKTRNFPRNFNEAKYIGITLYLTCSVWLVFLPSYFNAADVFWKTYLFCCVFTFVGTITLCGLFLPKVFVILCRNDDEVNTSTWRARHLVERASPYQSPLQRRRKMSLHCPTLKIQHAEDCQRVKPPTLGTVKLEPASKRHRLVVPLKPATYVPRDNDPLKRKKVSKSSSSF